MVRFDKYEKFGDYHWQEYQAGGSYQQHVERVREWINEEIVLDLGAGDGLITSIIGAIGLDDNLTATRLARKHDVKIIDGSAYSVPFPKNSFQAVFLGDVIEHLEDESKALAEIWRVLQDDGFLYITTPPARKSGKLHDPYHLREYSQKDLISLVERCGYSQVQTFVDDELFNIYAKFKKAGTLKDQSTLKILIFTHSSMLAGAERSLIDLVKLLNEDYGMHCTVVLPSPGPSVSLLEKVGASTIIAPLNWWCSEEEIQDRAKVNRLYAQSFNWITDTLNLLNDTGSDIILTNTMVIPWGAMAAMLLKKPHVWMVNEFGEMDHALKFYEPFNKIKELIISSSDKVVTRSEAIRKMLFSFDATGKTQTIYRHIDLNTDKMNIKNNQKNWFSYPDTTRLIIMGQIIESKGQKDAVLAAIELIKNRQRKVELILVGYANSSYKQRLEEQINDKGVSDYIRILPFQENVIPIVNEADIVLVCSKMEAFGRVVLEGLLLEKPVIATNTGGTPEMITDGETGLLYTPGDYHQLADQIEKIMENPELGNELARKGYCFAKKTFTEENFGGRYFEMMNELKKQDFRLKGDSVNFLLNQYQNLTEENNKTIQGLNKDLAEREQTIQQLNTLAEEKNKTIQDLNTDLAEREQKIRQLNEKVAEYEQEVLFYALSKSWRMTRPFRKVMSIFRRIRNE